MAVRIVTTMTELMTELKSGDQAGQLMFFMASATWCTISKRLRPSFQALIKHWRQLGVSINAIEFDIDEAVQISTYFNVQQPPYFICLLPQSHATLTVKELRWGGSDSVGLVQWMNTIMQKWLTWYKAK